MLKHCQCSTLPSTTLLLSYIHLIIYIYLSIHPTHPSIHQEIEFTIENGVLFLLQSFTAKRTARAAVCVAVSMVKEKIITEREALLRIDPHQMQYFLHPMIDPTYGEQHLPIHTSIYPSIPGAVR